MNKANNKRRKDSIERIERVFIDLLQTKELNQVSISDICKQANLNRTTFYANYRDIYDLADSIRDKLENNASALCEGKLGQGVDSNDYLELFRHIKENQLFYKTYFKLGYDENYKIIRYDMDFAQKHFKNCFVEYHVEFFKAGITKIIKMWLQNGCKESPEDMFDIIKSEYQERI